MKKHIVEVYKTNVQLETQATGIVEYLNQFLPDRKINFDLQDHDRILRIAGYDLNTEEIINILASKGYTCELLE